MRQWQKKQYDHEKLSLYLVIKLLTKSKENIDKRNNIMIRGEGIVAK